jgi:hypothetical protein
VIEGSGVSAKSIVRELVPPVLWRILSKIKGRIQGPSASLPHPPVDPWQGREADAGLLGPDDRRFIETRLPELTGWLDANAAYFAAYMLNAQHAASIKGPVLEIGVFAGKFLMLQTPDRNRSCDTRRPSPTAAIIRIASRGAPIRSTWPRYSPPKSRTAVVERMAPTRQVFSENAATAERISAPVTPQPWKAVLPSSAA